MAAYANAVATTDKLGTAIHEEGLKVTAGTPTEENSTKPSRFSLRALRDESFTYDHGKEILRARLWANQPSAARAVEKEEKKEAMIKARILASIASAAEAKATRAEAAKAEAAKAKAAAAKAAWRENRKEAIKEEDIEYARRATRLANLIEHMKTVLGLKDLSMRERYMRDFWTDRRIDWIERKIDLIPDDGLFGHVMVERVSDWLSLPRAPTKIQISELK
jgi:hypothetical protein